MADSNFNFQKLDLNGAYLITYYSVDDHRGGFAKNFHKDIFHNAGINFQLSETFISMSAKNVLRGLHFQINNPQAKLVCVPYGSAYDVLVDLRPRSTTFKLWQGFELSRENHKALYIPKGFAHGFLSLENDTQMLYQCDGAYDKETDTGIRIDDSDIAVSWPIDLNDAFISQRDLQLMSFEAYFEHPMKI